MSSNQGNDCLGYHAVVTTSSDDNAHMQYYKNQRIVTALAILNQLPNVQAFYEYIQGYSGKLVTALMNDTYTFHVGPVSASNLPCEQDESSCIFSDINTQ